MSNTKIDMLHGPLLMKIIVFALPLAASSMLQQLFNSIDVAVVGRFVGSDALAAVGSNGPVISLLINLFIGVSMGANVIISNHIGQNDNQGIRRAVNTVSFVALISGLFLMILGFFVAKPILLLIDTPKEVIDMAALYLRIYFIGMPFFMIFNFGAAILRSMGDTKRPLYILVVSGIVNVVLNLIFVLVFDMGIAGVAIATSISNAVSAVVIVILLLKEEEPFRLHLNSLKIYNVELKRMLQIGIPAGIQGMIFSLSNVVVQSEINSYGASAVAGSAAALNFEYYCYFIIQGFNGAAISFIGQNYGAGNIHRVRRIFYICLIMSFVLCGCFNGLFIWQENLFLSLFTTDADVIPYGVSRMNTVLAFQFVASSYEIAGSSMRGMGKSVTPALLTVFGTCLLRIAWVGLVCPLWRGFDILMFVYPLSWGVTGILVLVAYYAHIRHSMQGIAKI